MRFAVSTLLFLCGASQSFSVWPAEDVTADGIITQMESLDSKGNSKFLRDDEVVKSSSDAVRYEDMALAEVNAEAKITTNRVMRSSRGVAIQSREEGRGGRRGHITRHGQITRHGPVLYVIKTWSGYFKTKLVALMQTWGSLVEEDHLLIMADPGNATTDEELADLHIKVHKVPTNVCGADSTKCTTIRVAHGIVLASKHPGNWSWVFMVDDDHYINTAELEQSLAKHDATGKVAVGEWGCGVPLGLCDGLGGFCGGCGYGFSRPAVQALLGGSAEGFLAFHQNLSSNSKLTQGREDMTTSCAAHMRVPDMKIVKLDKHMEDTKWIPAMKKNLSEAAATSSCIGWHHVSAEQMRVIHQSVSHAKPHNDSMMQMDVAGMEWRMNSYIDDFNKWSASASE